MDCRRPGSSVHGILQARTLEWVATPSSRGFSHPGIEPTFTSPALTAGSLPLACHLGRVTSSTQARADLGPTTRVTHQRSILQSEDKLVGWHHRLNGHEREQTPGDTEGQGSLACCNPWGRKESDMTERLNNNTSVSCEINLVFCNGSFLLFNKTHHTTAHHK